MEFSSLLKSRGDKGEVIPLFKHEPQTTRNGENKVLSHIYSVNKFSFVLFYSIHDTTRQTVRD